MAVASTSVAPAAPADTGPAATRFGLRNIFILPTVDGAIVALTLLILLLIAVNYEVQLIYLTVFLVAALLNGAMVLGHRNLHGLTAPRFRAGEAFVGHPVKVMAHFEPTPQARSGLLLTLRHRRRWAFLTGARLAEAAFELAANERGQVALTLPPTTRGWHPLPPASLSTRYPLGLFRAWALPDDEGRYLVYPAPAGSDTLPLGSRDGDGDGGPTSSGTDEYVDLARYRTGDAVNRIAWRQFALRGELYTKAFESPRDAGLVLRYGALTGLDKEARLSQLTRWVLDASDADLGFRLELPDRAFGPDRGEAHRRACLEALAEFP